MDKEKISKMDLKLFNSGILPPDDDQVWLSGGISGITYDIVQPDGDFAQFFPQGERQKFRLLETMACTSYTANDSVETQINRLIKLNLIETEPIKDWLDSNGDFNASDRFTAKMSGTTTMGNSLNRPAESWRINGCCPEAMWPGSDNFYWNDYYCEITQNIKDKAKKLLDYFSFPYYYLDDFLEALKRGKVSPKIIAGMVDKIKQAPINIATAVCPGWFPGTDIIQACNYAVCHATLLGKIDTVRHILDHYEPYQKRLALNYYIAYPLQIIVIPKDNIKKKNMDAQQFLLTHDLAWLRNLKTGAFGRVIHGKLQVATGKDRTALMLMDDKIRQGGLNISDELWQSLDKVDF